ncbi:Smr protein/MutS2 [Fibrella aestuarina BUZ 2]|uniref:Smr protein/MutS2 n=1 Tax=Fibrella aestuarina BUZ 2 TaxID=1166018 RepID=I0KCG7_9BACT|nr:Smr/MutS family protein [Fibrella aestuarina]CCH01820.1 Smr protein/MutS2 [Fibrella aestuarina BUZ 2]
MNIGDKVRMVRATEQGVVTRFLSGGRVEIEIEDGFRIPVLQSEIVVVSPMEAERFKPSTAAAELRETIAPQRSAATAKGQILANVGLYLAFVSQNDRDVALHVVNNTDWELLLTIAEEREGRYRGLQSLTLKAKTQTKLLEQYQMERFEQWPTLLVQAVYFRGGVGQPARMPLVKRLKPRAQQFYKNKQNVPVLNQPGHVFLLDDEAGAASLPSQPEQIKEAMLSPTDEQPLVVVDRPTSVVDLHIEKLLPAGPGSQSPGQLVDIQLRAFEKNLENAIASGMGEITFIHGVGSGKLRQEIHRQLSRHPNVRFFEDAQKQKFGYGATKVTLK